ncbi:GIY-YIG nuclease family protein [Alteromonas flava]|uniref:GIY-YIG nuclease family protein n=1 Tax=Alteromonas flava TaxID=2048003 RepID=UPI000C285FF4|nr:GIY-YIG nuclease family protein [Alteromonas flava]
MNQEKSAAQPAQSNWYVYIIENRLGQLYTGITTNVERRLSEHAGKPQGAKALKGKGPLQLMYTCPLANRSIASKAERWIKQQPRQNKLALIAGKLDLPDFTIMPE